MLVEYVSKVFVFFKTTEFSDVQIFQNSLFQIQVSICSNVLIIEYMTYFLGKKKRGIVFNTFMPKILIISRFMLLVAILSLCTKNGKKKTFINTGKEVEKFTDNVQSLRGNLISEDNIFKKLSKVIYNHLCGGIAKLEVFPETSQSAR